MKTQFPVAAKRISVLILLLLLASSLACRMLSSLGGSGDQVGSTVTVNGIKFQLTSSKESDVYVLNGETNRPTFDEDTFLILQANLSPSGVDAMSDLKVYVVDSTGETTDPTITSWWTEDANDSLGGRVEWVFVVKESSNGFVLTFPEGTTVELAPYLK